LETSLRSYTLNNAWAEGEEASKGSLTVGKLADLVVIDRDLFAIPPTQLKDAKVLLTMVGGRIVYSAAPFGEERAGLSSEARNRVSCRGSGKARSHTRASRSRVYRAPRRREKG